ncbi:MAG: InlB B-repeat-containing protein, partial [Coriobacteriia bacterium]|nr:InlB B-repeat-containing protein [Coriobacteriia bacterium]
QETLVGNNQQTVILSTETTTAPTELSEAPATVAVQSVAVDDAASLAALTSDDIGRVLYLNYLVTPANASDQDATWTSSDSNVLSVSADGVATVKGLGTAVVTVTTDDGGKIATAQVKVSSTTAQVTFKNGDQTIGTLSYTKGDALNTQLLPVPTASGKAFAGWSLSAGGAVVNTVNTPVTDNMTLYALWTDGGSSGGDPSGNIYKITYNLNGGANSPSAPSTYMQGTPVTLLPPTKAGYLFKGWYNNSTFFGDPVTTISNTSTGDQTFWAKWVANITASKLTISASSYIYTGSAIKPAVTVTSDGVTLGALDYIVTYGTNTAVGAGSVTVTAFNDPTYFKTLTFTIVPATPALASLANSTTGPLLKWNKAAGAAGYYVLRKSGTGSWATIKNIASAATLSYTDTTAVSGSTYSYSVRAYAGTGPVLGSYNTTGKTITYVAQPKLTSAVNSSTGVTFTWGKVSGATGYYVYRRIGTGAWTKVKTITSAATVSYLDKAVSTGSAYTYTVKAYKTSSANVSSYDITGKKVIYVAMPKLTSLANSKSGPVLKWGKITGATGYLIYRKLSGGSWVNIATLKSVSTLTRTDTTAVKGKTYYYSIRAYKTSTANISAMNTTGWKITVKK